MFKVQVAGNAFKVLADAARKLRASIWGAVKLGGMDVVRGAKINVKQKLNTTGESQGNLGRSIVMIPHEAELLVAVGPEAIDGAVHEFGATITPIGHPYLRFRGKDGEWVYMRSVKIPKRAYLIPAFNAARQKIRARIDAAAGKLFPGA